MSTARLNQERILKSAMELLDEEGFEAVTMRRLADRLGVVPMAVYRHFDGKGALVDAILDRATSEIDLPPPQRTPREALAALAREIRTTILRHASLVPALVLRPSLGPKALRMGERASAALREAGLGDDDVWRGWNLIAMYSLGFAIVEAPQVTPPAASGAMSSDLLSEASGEEEFPLAADLAPLPPTEFFSEAQFEHGLDRVLNGVLGRE